MWTTLLVAAQLTAPGARASGDRAVAIEIESPQDAAELQDMGVDLWTEQLGPGWVRARVTPQVWPSLAASDFEVEVLVPDLGPRVEEESFRVNNDPVGDHTAAFFDDYRELDEIYAHLDALIEGAPDIATGLDVGASLEGREIRGIEVSNADEDAPVLFLNAGQHAREWASMSTATCIADELVTRAGEPGIGALLDQIRVVIVPVVNPDGYVYTWDENRYWRKNRRGEHGVDTNRNFAVAWGGPGSSGNPEAGNFRGESEFSEPETAALRDLAQSYDTLRASVDIHCFGQLVLYPWGWADIPAPADDVLAPLAEDLAESLSELHGQDYVPLQGAQFYPASGNANDWFYGALGSYAFTYELRPQESDPHREGFVLPPDQIRPVCQEAMASIILLAEFAIASEPGVPGDDGNADTDGWGGSSSTSGGGSDGGPQPGSTSDGNASASVGTGTGTPPPPSTTAPAGSGTSGGSAPADVDLDDDGCACKSGNTAAPWGLLVLLLALRRRRYEPLLGIAPARGRLLHAEHPQPQR